MPKIGIFLTLTAALWAQQYDKSVRDLADQRDAASAERSDKLKVIVGAEKILRERLGSDLGSKLIAEAPFIHLRLMACMVKGDFSRQASKIYAEAAEKAAKAADEYEASTGAARGSSPQATEARRSLEDATRREAELRAKPALNGVEKAELEGLPTFMQQLRDTIALYERIEQPGPAAARAKDMARQMREKEALFLWMVKREAGNTKFYNAQCMNEFGQLEWIDQAEHDNQTIREYDRLGEGRNAPSGAVRPSERATATAGTPGLDDKDKLKEADRILSDPDELVRRFEQLKQLSGQGKSK
ncbi:hypothetical protein [Paludibaculum fermentans]|uniref:Uncharacterized protein n=1 Tax=Paludibaculum fermentans TaxID=1473598 RepID=A0A7S7SLL5_PALFE|nr:hypothetical protein [Paludibaculum fermentans]QOY88165.1 hypothetical protein IRI77_36425 [Paludibaculum fermentans]